MLDNLDERKTNIVKALGASLVVLCLVLGIVNYFIYPEIDNEMAEKINECNEDSSCTISAPSSNFTILFSVFPVLTYIIVFRHLEQRRFKSWRSYPK